SIHHHLFHNPIRTIEIEHDIEFTHILKVLVKRFNEAMDEFEDREFVLLGCDTDNEEEGGVSSVHHFLAIIDKEGTLVFVPRETSSNDFCLQCCTHFQWCEIGIRRKACLSLFIHEENV